MDFEIEGFSGEERVFHGGGAGFPGIV